MRRRLERKHVLNLLHDDYSGPDEEEINDAAYRRKMILAGLNPDDSEVEDSDDDIDVDEAEWRQFSAAEDNAELSDYFDEPPTSENSRERSARKSLVFDSNTRISLEENAEIHSRDDFVAHENPQTDQHESIFAGTKNTVHTQSTNIDSGSEAESSNERRISNSEEDTAKCRARELKRLNMSIRDKSRQRTKVFYHLYLLFYILFSTFLINKAELMMLL
jgi:hypothetical protein